MGRDENYLLSFLSFSYLAALSPSTSNPTAARERKGEGMTAANLFSLLAVDKKKRWITACKKEIMTFPSSLLPLSFTHPTGHKKRPHRLAGGREGCREREERTSTNRHISSPTLFQETVGTSRLSLSPFPPTLVQQKGL